MWTDFSNQKMVDSRPTHPSIGQNLPVRRLQNQRQTDRRDCACMHIKGITHKKIIGRKERIEPVHTPTLVESINELKELKEFRSIEPGTKELCRAPRCNINILDWNSCRILTRPKDAHEQSFAFQYTSE